MSLMKFKTVNSDKSTNSQRGFTLVELAIVLVIIGLIIAAVLKGQELIVSARLKSTISDISGIRSAANTFRDKYNALPGDYANAQSRVGDPSGITWATCDGTLDVCDGDGVIEGDGTDDETLLFWAHLSAANLITGVSPVGTSTIIGEGFPTSPIGGGLTIRNEQVTNKTAHWISLGSADATPTGILDSEQAMIMDEKSDDGRPGTGSMRVTTQACTDSGLDPVDGTHAYVADPAIGQCLASFEL